MYRFACRGQCTTWHIWARDGDTALQMLVFLGLDNKDARAVCKIDRQSEDIYWVFWPEYLDALDALVDQHTIVSGSEGAHC